MTHEATTTYTPPGLICRSPRMQDLARSIARSADQPGGVIIVGEPGSGRGIVARNIHAASQATGAPFVAVYCHKADPARIEMELFGTSGNGATRPIATVPFLGDQQHHERIAAGSLLYRARYGTIYFVHLEELGDRVQARLARLFRDREAILGTNREPETFVVRPMTAVDVKGGLEPDFDHIRPDLYKRLASSTLLVPALRERREDIPELAEFLVARACRQRNVPVKKVAPEVVAVLSALPWKGNAREMNTLIESLVHKTDGPELGLAALLAYVRLDGPATEPMRVKATNITLRQARMQFEREYIASVLAQHRGRIPEAARALGIQRTNLYRKMRTLQLVKNRNATQA